MKNDKNSRIIIAAGGTAGHIYPAVSIIQYLRENTPQAEVLFLGTARGMEKELADKLAIDFVAVKASGFEACSSRLKKIMIYSRFLINFLAGFFSSLKILAKFRPDIVLGMGGYVCAPVLCAALFLLIPVAIHEQNSIPGRLNRFFSRYSACTFISFKSSEVLFPKKSRTVFSGNPIRRSVRNFYSEKPQYAKFGLESGRKTIIAFGGSLGANNINSAVTGIYEFLKDSEKLQIVLISGNRFYEECLQQLKSAAKPQDKLIFRVLPYVYEIEKLYRIADLAISRSGAITVAELDHVKVPAILVPYPEAIGNHQLYNAQYLADKKMARIINDADLNKNVLFEEISSILSAENDFAVSKNKTYNPGEETEDPAAVISGYLTGGPGIKKALERKSS